MRFFITETGGPDGLYVGPRIEAESWEVAQSKADAANVRLMGELMLETLTDGTVLYKSPVLRTARTDPPSSSLGG